MTDSMMVSPPDPAAPKAGAATTRGRVMAWLRALRRRSSHERTKAALTEIEAVHLSESGQRLRREAILEKRRIY